MKSIKEALPEAFKMMKEMEVPMVLTYQRLIAGMMAVIPTVIRNHAEMKKTMTEDEIKVELDTLYVKSKELISLAKKSTVTEDECLKATDELLSSTPLLNGINKETIEKIVFNF